MNAYRVEVFHGADGNDVAVDCLRTTSNSISFQPGDTLLDQNLSDTATGADPLDRDLLRLCLAVICDAAASAAQRKRGTNDHRIADCPPAKCQPASSTCIYALWTEYRADR